MSTIPIKEEESLNLLSVDEIVIEVNSIKEKLIGTEEQRRNELEKKQERESFIERGSLHVRKSIVSNPLPHPLAHRITDVPKIQEANRIKEIDDSLYDLLLRNQPLLMNLLHRSLFDWVESASNYYKDEKEKQNIVKRNRWSCQCICQCICYPIIWIIDKGWKACKVVNIALKKNCINYSALISFLFSLIGFLWQLSIGSRELQNFFNSLFNNNDLIDIIFHFGKR